MEKVSPRDSVDRAQARAAAEPLQARSAAGAAPAWIAGSPRVTAQRRVLQRAGLGTPGQRDAVVEHQAPRQAPVAEGRGGLPSQLRAGMEALSGVDLSDVRVHRNSSEPATLGALAYAQGNDIHLGPGQEQNLPHEAWHVVQQLQGRVRPTMQAAGVAINDDQGLESEADMMGERAVQMKAGEAPPQRRSNLSTFGRPQGHVSIRTEAAQPDVDRRLATQRQEMGTVYPATTVPIVAQRAIDVTSWLRLLVEGGEPMLDDYAPHFEAMREAMVTKNDPDLVLTRELLDYRRDPDGNELSQEAQSNSFDVEDSLLDELRKVQTRLQASNHDVDAIHEGMQRFGLPVTRQIVEAVKRYNYNSEWIEFTAENFVCWMRLATGQGSIRDAQYIIHEAIEIGEILKDPSGLDPFMTPEAYERLDGDEKSRLSDVMGGASDSDEDGEDAATGGDGLYASSHLTALEFEYKFVALQIRRLAGLSFDYRDIAAADPDRDEGRHLLLTPDKTAPLKDSPDYAYAGDTAVDPDGAARERLGLGSGALTLGRLVRVVKAMPVRQLRRASSAPVVQRQIVWASGTIHHDKDLAAGAARGNSEMGETVPYINGHTPHGNTAMLYDVPAPRIVSQETTTAPQRQEEEPQSTGSDRGDPVNDDVARSSEEEDYWGIEGTGVDEDEQEEPEEWFRARVVLDTSPVTTLGYEMHLPSPAPWTIALGKADAQAAVARLDRRKDTSLLADTVTLTVRGQPSDTALRLKTLDHEFEHVFIYLDHIYDVLWPIDRRIEEYRNREVDVTARKGCIKEEFWHTLFGPDDSPYGLLSGYEQDLTAAQIAFHHTDEGVYPRPTVTILDPQNVLVTVPEF